MTSWALCDVPDFNKKARHRVPHAFDQDLLGRLCRPSQDESAARLNSIQQFAIAKELFLPIAVAGRQGPLRAAPPGGGPPHTFAALVGGTPRRDLEQVRPARTFALPKVGSRK